MVAKSADRVTLIWRAKYHKARARVVADRVETWAGDAKKERQRPGSNPSTFVGTVFTTVWIHI